MEAVSYQLLDESWIRDAFPILKEVTYLNVGTYGLMPEPALFEFQAMQAEFERSGVASDGTFHLKAEETRKRIAALVDADPEEIAFTRNATDGINLVLAGMDWQPGDEVITSTEEHEAVMHPLLYLQRIKGIRCQYVEVSPYAEVMIDRLNQAYSPKTRLIVLSYITCETGTRLPAIEICRWATEHDTPCLLDGAQASGALPVNVRHLGCDYYASNGHKWMSGPKGTGFFYGRREALLKLTPAHVGAGSLEHVDINTGLAEPFSTGQRFEFGTRAWALYAGLGSSLDWFASIGWERVYGHIAALSDYLKRCILQNQSLELLTPKKFAESSGLVSFVVRDRQAGDVSQALREKWHIHTRVVPHYNVIRISTAHFNNLQDIDLLMDALEQITKGRIE